jgi:hypothetical protein
VIKLLVLTTFFSLLHPCCCVQDMLRVAASVAMPNTGEAVQLRVVSQRQGPRPAMYWSAWSLSRKKQDRIGSHQAGAQWCLSPVLDCDVLHTSGPSNTCVRLGMLRQYPTVRAACDIRVNTLHTFLPPLSCHTLTPLRASTQVLHAMSPHVISSRVVLCLVMSPFRASTQALSCQASLGARCPASACSGIPSTQPAGWSQQVGDSAGNMQCVRSTGSLSSAKSAEQHQG